jgi:hypothetical protein
LGNPPIHHEGALDFLPETYVNRLPLRALVALCEASNVFSTLSMGRKDHDPAAEILEALKSMREAIAEMDLP